MLSSCLFIRCETAKLQPSPQWARGLKVAGGSICTLSPFPTSSPLQPNPGKDRKTSEAHAAAAVAKSSQSAPLAVVGPSSRTKGQKREDVPVSPVSIFCTAVVPVFLFSEERNWKDPEFLVHEVALLFWGLLYLKLKLGTRFYCSWIYLHVWSPGWQPTVLDITGFCPMLLFLQVVKSVDLIYQVRKAVFGFYSL